MLYKKNCIFIGYIEKTLLGKFVILSYHNIFKYLLDIGTEFFIFILVLEN